MFELRAGRAADVEAMYRLDLLCFAPPFRFSLRTMRFYLSQENAKTVVAQSDGDLVGFVIVELDVQDKQRAAYIATLDVHPEHRRTGVASALMKQAEQGAAAHGADRMTLHVHIGNVDAVRFYRNNGYSIQSRAGAFYGEGLDAEVYSKALPGARSQSSDEKSSGKSR